MAEEALRQSLLLSRGSATIFLSRPIAAGFLGTALVIVLVPLVAPRVRAALRFAGALGGA
jgi:TctA family transporter